MTPTRATPEQVETMSSDTPTSRCCQATAQAVCCEPTAKAKWRGASPEPTSCGCQ